MNFIQSISLYLPSPQRFCLDDKTQGPSSGIKLALLAHCKRISLPVHGPILPSSKTQYIQVLRPYLFTAVSPKSLRCLKQSVPTDFFFWEQFPLHMIMQPLQAIHSDINNLAKDSRRTPPPSEIYPCPLFLRWGLSSSVGTLA